MMKQRRVDLERMIGHKVSPHLHNCHGIVESVTYESELLFHLYISFYMASFNRCLISCNNFHVRMGLGLWGTLYQISVYTVFLMFLDWKQFLLLFVVTQTLLSKFTKNNIQEFTDYTFRFFTKTWRCEPCHSCDKPELGNGWGKDGKWGKRSVIEMFCI